MTIIKLITKHPVLHPKPVREVYLSPGAVEMTPNWFGVTIKLLNPPEHPVVVPWSNVAEVVVVDADGFMESVSHGDVVHSTLMKIPMEVVGSVTEVPAKKPRTAKK